MQINAFLTPLAFGNWIFPHSSLNIGIMLHPFQLEKQHGLFRVNRKGGATFLPTTFLPAMFLQPA